ncbi:enoyl-CoA hydratase/isomerase family protein [Paenarthrobacter aurescens]|uniref:enoyl-CoA hydratase/isomerase family protein n=1 Tax=Paenarthrobacter aurescens TaxID=43663 RepID=UPI0035E9B1BB
MSDYGDINFTIEDDVLTIEIGTIDGATHEGLARVFRDAHHSEAKIVVVTGKDRRFLSSDNFDFEWISTLDSYDKLEQLNREAEDILRYSILIEKPMIAKVYAPGAHGIGASIALACDFVYASSDATFSDNHLWGMGLPPGDGGSVLWPSRIGLSRAREFLMTDRVANAVEAVDMGLINKAVATEDLDVEVDQLVEKLKSYDYSALRMTKKSLNQYLQHTLLTVGLSTSSAQAKRMVGGLSR